MVVHRLQGQSPAFKAPTPVKGEAAPQVKTEAGVKPAEIAAAQKITSPVSVEVLDAFLKARAAGGKPAERGLLPGLQRLFGAKPSTSPPSAEAQALQKQLGAAVTSLGAIYADGLVTEGELSQLQAARGQLRAVLGLADPAVLNMLPKDVREKLQDQLFEPLQVLDQAASRRADRVFVQVQQRDEGALREKLSEQPLYRHVDVAGLQNAGIPPFSLQRYQPGDLVAVPRSDGSVDKGVVVAKERDSLRVEVLDKKSGALGMKNLSAADVARANPLKIGDHLELPGLKLWVTGTGAGGIEGTVQDSSGQLRHVDSARIAQLAVSTFSHVQQPAQQLPPPVLARPQQPARQTQPMQQSSAASASAASSAAASAASSVGTVRTSRQSLDAVIETVWSKKAEFLAGALDVYGDVYNAVVDKNELKMSKGAFLQDLADLAKSRPSGFTSNTQSFGGSGDNISQVVESHRKGELPAQGLFSSQKLEGTFFRFERGPVWQPEKITQRVYLNAAADHATHLMKFVVGQILDNPKAFPGVEMSKLSGPGAVGGRSENIVIYTHGDDASQRVLAAITAYKAKNPSHFMSGVPAFTEQVAPGVATGDEPAVGGGRMSFGSLRAQVIQGALQQADSQGLGKDGFTRLVDDGLRRLQVDPQRPHKNLAASAQ